MKDLISRVVTMLGQSVVTGEDIHYMLVEEEGLSETQALYTYIAAKMVYKTTSEPMTFGTLMYYRERRANRH